MIGMKEQNRSVKQMKAGLCVSVVKWAETFVLHLRDLCLHPPEW